MYPVIEQIVKYIKQAKHYSRHKGSNTVQYRQKKKVPASWHLQSIEERETTNKISESGIERVLAVISAKQKTEKGSQEDVKEGNGSTTGRREDRAQ